MAAMEETVAGLLAIGTALLGTFVDVTETYVGSNHCGITTCNATLTSCGEAFVDQLAQLIYSGGSGDLFPVLASFNKLE